MKCFLEDYFIINLWILPAFCLEARVQPNQKGMIWGLFKDVFLCLNPINILILKKNDIQERLYALLSLSINDN